MRSGFQSGRRRIISQEFQPVEKFRLGSLNLNAATEIRPLLDDSGEPAVEVTGTAALGNAALTATWAGPGSPVIGSVIVLLENDGSDAVSGIFAGKPQGSIFTPAGAPSSLVQISYTGGTGNDVTLIVVEEPPVVWDAGGGNGNWNVAANWNPNGVPVNGSRLIFDNAPVKSLINNLPGAVFDSLEFMEDGYTLTGNAFSLSGLSGPDLIEIGGGGVTEINGPAITLLSGGNIRTGDPDSVLLLSGSGALNLNGWSLNLSDDCQVTITRLVTGAGGSSGFVCGRPGARLVLESPVMTHEGDTICNNGGTLIVDGFLFNSEVGVNSGGTLGGGGTLNAGLTVQAGAVLDPGVNGPGDLTVNGNVSASGVSTLRIRLHGTGSATTDRIEVNGTFAAGNFNLELIATEDGFYPGEGQTFHIVTNDGSDAVTGTFLGKPQNATVNIGPHQFRLSYTGGSGNDITLTAINRYRVWDGGGLTGNWTNADNWVGDQDIEDGDILIFPAGFGDEAGDPGTPDNNALSVRTFRALMIDDETWVKGRRIKLTHGVYVKGGTCTVPLELAGNQTWTVAAGGTLEPSIYVTSWSVADVHWDLNGHNLTMHSDGSGGLIDVPLRGAGNITKTGRGSWNLFNAPGGVVDFERESRFSGPVRIAEGRLNCRGVSALGTTGGSTTIESGARLDWQAWPGAEAVQEPITVRGTLSASASTESTGMLFGGQVRIEGSTARLESQDAALLLNGPLTGDGSVGISGDVLISGAGAATFSGAAAIHTGSLRLAKPPGVTALAGTGSVFIAGGALLWQVNGNQIADGRVLTVGDGSGDVGTLRLDGPETIGGLTLRHGTVTGAGALTVDGSVNAWESPHPSTLPALILKGQNLGVREWTINNGSSEEDLIVNGTTTNPAGTETGIHKLGAGLLRIGDATLPGITVMDGTVRGTGFTAGVLWKLDGGRIEGTNQSGSLRATNNGGTFSPGNGSNGTGQWGAQDVLWNPAVTYECRLSDATQAAGTGYDQLLSVTSVTLNAGQPGGGAALSILTDPDYYPLRDVPMVILDKFGAGAISGHFAGLPEGATLILKGVPHRISYVGGNGNDVTLTALTGTPRRWDGGGTGINSNWTNPLNWEGDEAPRAGDDLIFPAGHAGVTVNNFTAGTVFSSVLIEAGGYTFNAFSPAHTMTLPGGITSTHASGTVTWAIPLVLATDLKITNTQPGLLSFTTAAAIAANGHLLTVEQLQAGPLGNINLAGVISGSGSLRAGGKAAVPAGIGFVGVSIAGNNSSFTGAVQVFGGLRAAHANALGTGAGSTIVEPNGLLLLDHSGSTTSRGVILGSAAQIMVGGGTTLSGTLELSPGGNRITAAGSGTATVSGAILGPPAIVNPLPVRILATTPLRFTGSASNSFAGIVMLESGTLELAKSGSAVAIPSALHAGASLQTKTVRLFASSQINDSAVVTLDSSATLDLNGFNDTIGGLDLTASTVTTGAGTLTVAGNVTTRAPATTASISGNLAVSGAGRTWSIGDGGSVADLQVNAVVSSVSGGNVSKTGPGRINFTGNNTLSSVTVQEGSVFNEGTTTTTISQSNGTVGGTGAVANLVSTGGLVQPGQHGADGVSPGLLTCAQFSLGSASSLKMELLGTARGTQYDALNASGTVSLGNARLLLEPSFGSAPAANTIFTLISNTSGVAVSGTFDGLAQGAIFAAGGFRWQISYTGGASTRDVTVTNLPSTGVTRVWDGGGTLNNWNFVANWVGDVAPNPGDDLVFPAGIAAGDKATINNYAVNTTFNSIRIEDSGYSFAGGSISLNAGILCTYISGASTWSVITSLAQPQMWSTAGDGLLTVTTGGTSSPVPAKTLTLQTGGAAGGFQFNNTISGFLSITKTGPGSVTLNGPNTFTGVFSLLEGTVTVQHPTGLGGGSGSITVNQGTTLALLSSANLTFSRSLVLYGRLLSGGATHTINSNLFAISSTCTVEVMPGQTLNVTTTFIGQDSLRKTGGGTLVLQPGAFHNDELGDLHVDAGTVQLSAAAGFRALGGNLFIGGTPGIGAQVVLVAANQIRDTATVTLRDANAQFLTNNNSETIAHLDMAGGLVNSGSGTLTLTGSLTTRAAATSATIQGRITNSGAGQRVWTIEDGAAATDAQISAVVSASGGANLTKRGAGKAIFSGSSTPGNWLLEAGEVHVSGTVAGFVNHTGGILSGTGSAGDIFGNTAGNATIKPGGDPGLLTFGLFMPHPTTTLRFQINGTTRGTQYDAIDINNDTATLAGTLVLEIGGGFIPQRGETFTLLHGSLADPPGGNFNGLAEGASFVQSGYRWHITYVANGGIDTVLTCDGIAPTGTPRIWDGGAGGDPRWTAAANWQGDIAPSPGDDLIFPAGVSQLVAVNSFPAGTTFNSLNLAAGYTLTEASAGANGLLLIAGLTVDAVADTSFNIPLTLDAAQSFRFFGTSSHHRIESPVGIGSTAFTIDAGQATLVEINSVISGSGPVTKTGPGELRLTGFNTFTGAAALLGGTTSLTNAGALGTTTGGTTVSGLSTVLRLARPTPMILAENLTVQNAALAAEFAIHTFSGSINGTGSEASLSSGSGSRLQLSGVISGVSGWNVTQGDVMFTGTAANTFTGPLTIADGLLTLAKPNGVNALAGPLHIGTGNAGTLLLASPDQIPDTTAVTINGPDALFDTATFQETFASLTMTGGTTQAANSFGLTESLTTLPAATPARLTGEIALSHPGTFNLTVADGPAASDLLCEALVASNASSVDKLGTGSATFTAEYAGNLRIAAGLVTWNCNSPSANVTVAGGTLAGTGVMQKLLSESTGGIVTPGSSPGTLTCARLALDPTVSLRMEAGGPNAGTEFDQIILESGEAGLDDAILDFGLTFSPEAGDSFALITGATSISGTFAGLPEGALLFKPGGHVFQITYTGGTGSDVVLTAIEPTAPEITSSSSTPGTGGQAGQQVVAITGTGIPGAPYVLEMSTDLIGWTIMQTTTATAGGEWSFTDASQPRTAGRIFARVLLE